MNPNLAKYKTVHLWMIVPMLIMQAGIFSDYLGDFSENAWSAHIHYLTGTIGYLYLVIQPSYATQGQLARHRTNSIIGMFLAGAVCVTAPEEEKPQERWKLIYEFLGVKKPTFSLFSNV